MAVRFASALLAASLILLPLGPASAQANACGNSEYDCAVFYVERQQFEKAISALNNVLRQSPNDLKALNLLGIALTESGKKKNAEAVFQQALAVDPHFVPARKNLAINLFDAKRTPEAAAEFAQVVADAPGDEVAHLYLGEINFRRGNLVAAARQFERGKSRVTLKPDWTMHYGQCLMAQKEFGKAAGIFELLPEWDGERRFEAAVMLGQANAYEQAAELFASARKRYRDPYAAGYNQILMLLKAESYAPAIQVFQEMVTAGYKKAELYNIVSEAYLKTGRVQDAYDALRTATQLEPETEDNYLDLASVCLEYEEYALGKDILDVGIHYIPRSYRLYIQRGVTLVMRGSLDEAEKDFATASSLAPDKSLPYFALGWVWIQSGQTQKAIDVLREKSKLPGIDYLVPYVFAVALVHAGAEAGSAQAEEAVQALEESLRLNPGFAHAHAELGKLLFKQGNADRAITELRAAIALDPNDSGPLYTLAQAYRKKGDRQQADQMMARVAQLHSEDHNQDLKKELVRLVRQDAGPTASQASR
jgi:tetratricopeptide (TPR) repeat protein